MNFNTIKKRKQFIFLRNKCQFIHTKMFIIGFLLDEDKKNTKPSLGITVSKRNGNAVVRNKIKRRFKNAIHQILAENYNEKFLYISVVAKPLSLKADFEKIKQIIKSEMIKYLN